MADSIFASDEGGTHATNGRTQALLHAALRATAAPPTQLLSRERTGPSNSKQVSEHSGKKILVRAGERWMGKEMGKEGGALISDESTSVNCC